MERGQSDEQDTTSAGEPSDDQHGYPTNHVVGVINTEDAATRAVEALTAGGFLDSEIQVAAGQAVADAMDARTGRTGLANLAIRIAERLGVANDEMEVKELYEQALRDGHFVLFVEAATEAQQERAMQALSAHGAHSVNFMGRFSRTALIPPDVPPSGV